MNHSARCLSCNADWRAGQYGDTCETCGGGAMERLCPVCLGVCGMYWSRAVLDSNDSRLAHWHGTCAFQGSRETIARYHEAGVRVTWWLDDAALPSLLWACLITARDRCTVIDLEGAAHSFPETEAAIAWLRVDEYDCLTDLRFNGQVDRKVGPPAKLVDQVASFLQETLG